MLRHFVPRNDRINQWFPRLALLFLLAAGQANAGDGVEADVSLITAADIARERPVDVMDMLRNRVGLDENNSVITMRGVRGIAIFVDGFSSSSSELHALKPEQVEKIEILRGAASARFGAEAMGGAIAVTTRSAHRVHGSLTQGYDSRDGHYTRLSGGGETGGLGWSALLEDKVSKDFRTVPDSPFPYQITVEDEGSRSTLLDGKLGWRGDGLELSANLKRLDSKTFLGRPHWAFDWRTDNARATLAWRATQALTLEASLGEERYASSGVRDRGTGVDAAGLAPDQWLDESYRQIEGNLALAWSGNGWSARTGVNLVDLTENFSNADYATRKTSYAVRSSIRKEALFASAEFPVAAGRLELALRRDWQRYAAFSVFDAGPPVQEIEGGGVVKAATSPKVALSWPMGAGYQWRGSVGTGFSPPSAAQLYNGYSSAGAVTLANPGLQPERSVTADIGLTRAVPEGSWGVTLFSTRWEDKIGTRIVSYATPVVQQPQNVGEVAAHGVEAQWARRFSGKWSVTANYTYNRTRIVRNYADPSVVGNELPDMPRHKANLAVSGDWGGGLSVQAKLRLSGSAFTDDANTVADAGGYRWKKPGFAVLDVSGTWRRPAWELTVALNNALNRDYVTGFFWHQEPRTLRGELTLRY